MAGGVVWRIARRPYALERLGTGAYQDGGRWNHPGTGVIYASRTIAIATLEEFVHVAGIVPNDLVLVRVELPDEHSGEEPELADLPGDWNLVPPGPSSMAFGTAWARANRSLVLYAPSLLVPEERNVILNPSHPEFREVRMRIERKFQYDPRMYLPRKVPRATG